MGLEHGQVGNVAAAAMARRGLVTSMEVGPSEPLNVAQKRDRSARCTLPFPRVQLVTERPTRRMASCGDGQ